MLTPQDRCNALNYLYDKANPVLKLWAAERLGVPGAELKCLRAEMLQQPEAQHWLNCLLSFPEKPAIHGSNDICLENSMRKVLLFGIRESDDPRLVILNKHLIELLIRLIEHPNYVDYVIIASYLAAMDHAELPIQHVILERLESTNEFITLGGMNSFHTDPAGFPKIPAARQSHPLIHPRFYGENRGKYPLVYDLYIYANLPMELAGSDEIHKQLGGVIAIVLDERYQRLPYGYGLLFTPPNKYYSMGWSVHLPRFFGEEDNRLSTGGAVWWAEAMAHFPAAVHSDWFRRMMEHLESFHTDDGFWKFPAQYLTEGPNHYFVGGGHMGLGENRKGHDALKLESTAWMLRIDDAVKKSSIP